MASSVTPCRWALSRMIGSGSMSHVYLSQGNLPSGFVTVKTYVRRLLMKCGGTDCVHLVIAAYEGGLV